MGWTPILYLFILYDYIIDMGCYDGGCRVTKVIADKFRYPPFWHPVGKTAGRHSVANVPQSYLFSFYPYQVIFLYRCYSIRYLRRPKFYDLRQMLTIPPPLPRLAEIRTGWQSSFGSVSLISIILYLYVILDVGAGGDGGHVAGRELLQLLGLKGIGASLSSDGLCPFRPHSPHRDLPQYGGVIVNRSHTLSIRLFPDTPPRMRDVPAVMVGGG